MPGISTLSASKGKRTWLLWIMRLTLKVFSKKCLPVLWAREMTKLNRNENLGSSDQRIVSDFTGVRDEYGRSNWFIWEKNYDKLKWCSAKSYKFRLDRFSLENGSKGYVVSTNRSRNNAWKWEPKQLAWVATAVMMFTIAIQRSWLSYFQALVIPLLKLLIQSGNHTV